MYSVVAADSRSPRDGRFIEDLGRYNPLSEPATVDLKSDRAAGVLVAKAAHAEKRGGPAAVPALAAELRRMAAWLELGDVRAENRGDLGPLLVREMGR